MVGENDTVARRPTRRYLNSENRRFHPSVRAKRHNLPFFRQFSTDFADSAMKLLRRKPVLSLSKGAPSHTEIKSVCLLQCHTPGSIQYVKDMSRKKSRDAMTRVGADIR